MPCPDARRVAALPWPPPRPGHIGGGSGSGTAQLQFRKETQSAVDGNTVHMDVERAQITDNAMQYQILTQLIGDKFKGIRSALASTNS